MTAKMVRSSRIPIWIAALSAQGAGWCIGRDRIVVSTSRCGRDNPGSNPGHGRAVFSVTA